MSPSFLIGMMFAVSGFILFLSQVATVEITRAHRHIHKTIHDLFGHDTFVYPDYVHAEDVQQSNPVLKKYEY